MRNKSKSLGLSDDKMDAHNAESVKLVADESTNAHHPTIRPSDRRLAVCTVSTKVGKTTENFLTLCQRVGHDVYVLGRGCEFPHKVFGQPWKWRTKIYLSAIYSLMKREKDPYRPTDLVICCDSGDLLIVDGPDVIISKYENLIKASPTSKQLQVIMGVEAMCCRCVYDKRENEFYRHVCFFLNFVSNS